MRLLAFLALAGAAYAAAGVFLTVVVSFFLAVLLEPLTAWLSRRGLARKWAAAAAVSFFVVLTIFAGWACARPVEQIYQDVPRYAAKLRAMRGAMESHLQRFEKGAAPPKEIPPNVSQVQVVGGGESSWWSFLFRATRSFLSAAGIAIFVPFLSLFALMEKDLLLRAASSLLGGEEKLASICRAVSAMVRAYFLGSLMAGLGMALAQGIMFKSLGLSNVVGLGLLTGFANLVPLLGLPAAVILAAAQALLQFNRPLPFVVIALVITTLHIFTESLLIPRFIAGHVKLNSTAATLALLVWGWLWGAIGFLLAVPLTATIRILLEHHKEGEAIAALLRSERR